VQAFAFFFVQTITARRQNIVNGHQLDLLALGQVSRFVENQAALANVGSERLHRP
jgi:hypothetical protein